MLLRASSELMGNEVDLAAVTDDAAAPGSGIAHAALLLRFTTATIRGSKAQLEQARVELLDAMGPEALVDAAAVIGCFERMVRIADATGIPLDPYVDLVSGDIRDQLGLAAFASARNTKTFSPAVLAIGRRLRPVVARLVHLVGRLHESSAKE